MAPRWMAETSTFLKLVLKLLVSVVALVAALWNLGLSLFARTTISLFAIPCWLLFLLIGSLRYCGVIGG